MIEVRAATTADWATWRDVRLRALEESPGAFGSTLERERAFVEAYWRDRLASMPVLALDGERPVGLGGGHRGAPGVAQVWAMWVDPAYRGRGLSHRILDLVVAAARAEGRRVRLDVACDNPAARAAYLSYGFVPTGATEPLRPGSADLVEVMELPG